MTLKAEDLSDVSKENRMIELMRDIKLLKNHPVGNIQETISKLQILTEEIRKIVGIELEYCLNAHANEPVLGLDSKREAAKSLNDLLDGLGLRIKCPRSGRGGALIGLPNSDETNTAGNGRFQLRVGGPNPRSSYSVRFPKIELVLRDMRERGRAGRIDQSAPER